MNIVISQQASYQFNFFLINTRYVFAILDLP